MVYCVEVISKRQIGLEQLQASVRFDAIFWVFEVCALDFALIEGFRFEGSKVDPS